MRTPQGPDCQITKFFTPKNLQPEQIVSETVTTDTVSSSNLNLS
jgi:hypothetical protein